MNTSGGLRLSSPANFVNIGEIQPCDRVDLLLSKQIKYRCAWIYFRCVKEAELKILYIKSIKFEDLQQKEKPKIKILKLSHRKFVANKSLLLVCYRKKNHYQNFASIHIHLLFSL